MNKEINKMYNASKTLKIDGVISAITGIDPGVRKIDELYPALFQTLILQNIYDYSGDVNSFEILFNKESIANGLKEYITTSLFDDPTNFIKEITLNDFNDFNTNDTILQQMSVGDTKYMSYTLLDDEFSQAFINGGLKQSYVNDKILKFVKSFKDYYMRELAKIIILGKYQIKTKNEIQIRKNDGTYTLNKQSVYNPNINKFEQKTVKEYKYVDCIDKVFNIKITGKNIETATEKDLTDMLRKMRNVISDMNTFSNLHTKFGEQNPKFKTRVDKNNLVIIWNSRVINKILDLTAKLYNKNDVLLDLNKVMTINFSLLRDLKGKHIFNFKERQRDNTGNIVTYIDPNTGLKQEKMIIKEGTDLNSNLADNFICLIGDKRALIAGFDIDKSVCVTKMPKFKHKVEHIYRFGFVKLLTLPIYKFVIDTK